MRGRLMLVAAGLGLFVVGLLVGAIVFAGDDDSQTSRPAEPSRSVLDAPTTTGYTAQPVIAGSLHDGRPWTLRLDPSFGLCPIIGNIDFGCDVPNNDPSDRATPRKAVERTPFSDPQSGILVYGFLPPGATKAELLYDDGRAISNTEVVEPTAHFWAAPITPGDNPPTIVYRSDDGAENARYPA
jgi:hypothetical protein